MKILNKTNLKILSIETAGMAEMKTQASCSSQQPSYVHWRLLLQTLMLYSMSTFRYKALFNDDVPWDYCCLRDGLY